jgi:hypothetical protein
MMPALIAELRKCGFVSHAEDANNAINAILHRHKPPFKRASGRWFLVEVSD